MVGLPLRLAPANEHETAWCGRTKNRCLLRNWTLQLEQEKVPKNRMSTNSSCLFELERAYPTVRSHIAFRVYAQCDTKFMAAKLASECCFPSPNGAAPPYPRWPNGAMWPVKWIACASLQLVVESSVFHACRGCLRNERGVLALCLGDAVRRVRAIKCSLKVVVECVVAVPRRVVAEHPGPKQPRRHRICAACACQKALRRVPEELDDAVAREMNGGAAAPVRRPPRIAAGTGGSCLCGELGR